MSPLRCAVSVCVFLAIARAYEFWEPRYHHTVTGTCLDDAVPASQRRWSGPTGRNVTTTIPNWWWTHVEIAMRILVLLIRERLGIHIDALLSYAPEHLILYAAVAGCNDWESYACDDFTGEDPPLHFALPWFTSVQSQADDLMADAAASDAYAHTRVVNMGAFGYLDTNSLWVFQDVVDSALNASGGSVNLDWHRDLKKDGVMEFFTPYSEIEMSAGIYQSCTHSDARDLESWGYVCNPDYEASSPWRRAGANGEWDASGAAPGLRPMYTCSDLLEHYPSTYQGWSLLGYECRGDGWWLAPPCASKSPGDEWRDVCFVAIYYIPSEVPESAPGLATLPAVAASVSWYDVLKEYANYWTSSHALSNAVPPTLLFGWYEPDASLELNYGSDVRYTKVHFDPSLAPFAKVPTIIAHEDLYSFSPETASLLERFEIKSATMSGMMTTVVEKYWEVGDLHRAHDEIACDWVREHRDTWEGWTGASSCWADTYFDEARGRCVLCPDGTTSPRASTGLASCQPCDAGFVYDSNVGCVTCDRGFYADSSTQVCTGCPLGTYAEESGASSCTPCPAGFTTTNLHSRNVSECVCTEGSYLPLASLACAPCPEGMTCEEGRDESVVALLPQLQHGYWSSVGRPLHVYRCFVERHCPGGPAETCATHRDGTSVACGKCQAGTFLDATNACRACDHEGWSDWVPVLLCMLVAAVGLVLVVFLVNQDVLQEQNATITCASVAGLTVTGLQTLGMFDSLSVTFTSPLSDMLQVLSLLSFNIRLRSDCFHGHDVLQNYVLRQLILPTCLLVVAVILGIKTRLKHGYLLSLMNTTGTILSIVFISIVISTITPLILYEHPSGNGWSVRTHPSVLLASSEFAFLLLVAIVSFLLLVFPFVTVVVYATVMYPRFVCSFAGNWQLLAFRFLFFRFRPSSFYYGAFVMTRSLLLCLVPVVIQDNPATQMMVMSVVILAGLVLQALTRPWKNRLTNIFDGVVTAGLQLILICAALSTDMLADEEQMSILGTVSVYFIFCAVAVAMVVAVYQRLRPHPRYDVFVCHHKAEASAQARLLKCIMRAMKIEVFLDSDDLQHLDTLFDMVRCRVLHVIVYLTRGTLSRPWCAGEIVTAHRNSKRTTVVLTDGATGFAHPTEQEMDNLTSYVDGADVILSRFLISMADVQRAYRWLLSEQVPAVRFPAALRGRQRFEGLVSLLLHGSVGAAAPPRVPQHDYLLVSSDPLDSEATAAAGILCTCIEQELLGITQHGAVICADHEDPDVGTLVRNARAVVVLLTACTLEALPQLAAMVSCMQRTTVPVIPVATPLFQFPGANFYDTVLPALWTGDVDVPQATELIRAFFQVISLPLAVDSSTEVIDAQSKVVLQRVPRKGDSTTRVLPNALSGVADGVQDNNLKGVKQNVEIDMSDLQVHMPEDSESDGEVIWHEF